MPARTPPKPAPRERSKVAAAVVLALVLGATLLWPSEDSAEPVAAEPVARRLATENVAAQAADGGPSASSPKLPRLDYESIAEVDPFVAKGHHSDALSEEFANPQLGSDHVLASARTEVRAVYRTARGAVAIVDDQIVPVKDPKKWIESMRSADADP